MTLTTVNTTVLYCDGVFNFNFLALLLSEILGGSQIYTSGPYALWTPTSGKIFVPKASTLQYLIVFFNFNILALVVSEILRGPKFMLGGLCPCTPPSEKKLHPRRVLYYF